MTDIVERLLGEFADDVDKEAAAEIQRLHGLLSDTRIIMDSHNNIVGNLQAEIQRLRELLREGLEHHDEYNWQQRIRETLGE